MSNLRLKDHTWDAANVYDSSLGITQEQINAEVGMSLAGKQGTLVSGENIKTLNGASILGSGNIEIPGGGTGEDGYSPVVTISNITGGHRVNITDKTHQQGQNFDVMDGAKGDTGDPAPASAVVPAVESWLAGNITQETGYVIDDSLTVTGAAADAKKTGDEISGVKSALNPLYNWMYCNFCQSFESGGLNEQGEAETNKFSRTVGWINCRDKTYKIHINTGYRVLVFYYASDNFESYVKYIRKQENEDYEIEKGYYIKILAGYNDGSKFTDNDQAYFSFVSYEYTPIKDLSEITTLLSSNIAEPLSYRIASNGSFINSTTGEVKNSSAYAITWYVDISKYSHILYSNYHPNSCSNPIGMAFFDSENSYVSGHAFYVSPEPVGYKDCLIKVPDGAQKAVFTLRTNTAGFRLIGIRSKPLSGLYLSILGDSMSAADSSNNAGTLSSSPVNFVPSGNALFYKGSNMGVKNISEMWWMHLCNETGMTPLVIDAWSGSSICYNYSHNENYNDQTCTPMCSNLRTERLRKNDIEPDIIIIAGGGNDYRFAAPAEDGKSATTPIGTWDGHTPVNSADVLSGNSTFTETYAYLIKKLQATYPNAVIVCATIWNSGISPSESGSLVPHNNVNNITTDYSNAIKKVAQIMGVPVVDVSNVGFTEYNYIDNYSVDTTNYVHASANGQDVFAKRFVDALPHLVSQIK